MKFSHIEELLPLQAFNKSCGRLATLEGGGSGGGGSSSPPPANTSTTTTREIPAWAQPAAQNLLARGEALSNIPYQSYQGQRIADMTGEQRYGLDTISNRALYGSPEEAASRQQFTDTMSGKYLDPASNPYLSNIVNRTMGDVASKVNSQFGGSNYGTTAHQETLTRNLSDAATNIYGQNYSAERTNQMKGLAVAPQFNNIDYSNAQQLIGVGDIKRQESQDVLNNQYADWVAAQNQPYRQIDVLGNALGAAVNGQGSVQAAGYASNPYQTNRYANAIGGGLAGYQLANSLSGGEYGGYGALAGGLLGYMGS